MPITRTKKSDKTTDENSSGLVVTAQQTRFHENDDSNLKDVDINNLSIAIGKRTILQSARLLLKAGLRYVFVGRNGLGKSTVLKALAERHIPGIAPNIRILLLDQTMIETNQKDMLNSKSGINVLQSVIANDKIRQRLLDDSNALSDVLEKDKVEDVSQTYRALRLERAERELYAAQLLAQHRSGARGSKARQAQIEQEGVVATAKDALKQEVDATQLSQDLDAATVMLGNMQLELDAMGSATVEARARSTLIGLGFSQEQIEGPMNQLSGGWQTRAALAAALIQKTDVLLLDEPTNFLDLPAVIWLQHYLTNELTDTTLVVTTHDRDFADAVAERLIIIRLEPPFTLETFNGTLSDYYAESKRQYRRMKKMSDDQDKEKDRMKTSIQKSMVQAKKSGDDKRTKQAMSKKKKLDERMGLQVSAKGTRFKLSRDMAGWHDAARASIDVPEFDPPVTMAQFPEPPDLRNPGSLVSLEKVGFTYAARTAAERKIARTPTLSNISLVLHPGSRAALVGLNGSGKSTLVNLITADLESASSSLGKVTGTLTKHPQARVAHYTQHETSRLLALGQVSPDLTALSYLRELHTDHTEQQLRALLSGLALPSQAQVTPIRALSGGQLVRLGIAIALLPTSPHLLILDEPTTHLDADSTIALIRILKAFTGALLVVSHDRFFIRCVVEGQSVNRASADGDGDAESGSSDSEDEVANTGKVYRLTRTSGRMIHLERGMDEYEEIVVRQLAKNGVLA